MKPSEIKIGHAYANKSGRSIRKVLEISSDIKPKWLGTPGCAPDKGIKFEQVRVGMTANGNIYEMYLPSFANWAHHEVQE